MSLHYDVKVSDEELKSRASAECVVRRESKGCLVYNRKGNCYIPFDDLGLEIFLTCNSCSPDRPVDFESIYEKRFRTVDKSAFWQFIYLCKSVGLMNEDGHFNGYILDNKIIKDVKHFCAPSSVTLQLTRYCNFRCPHCWASAGRPRENELTDIELKNLFTQMSDMGVFILDIGSGGEAMGRDDFLDILKMAKDTYGFTVNVHTNACNVTKFSAAKMANYVDSFIVYIDAGTQKVYDSVHGCDQFRKAFRCIDNLFNECKRSKIYFHASITKDNFGDIPNIIKKTEDNNADGLIFDVALPVGRALQNLDKILSRDDVLGCIKSINDSIENHKKLKITLTPTVPSPRRNRSFEGFGCDCANQSCYITSEGLVYPADILSVYSGFKYYGNLRTKSLFDIWNGDLQEWRSSISADLECKRCPHYAYCRGGCRARTYVLTGDQRKKDPYCFLNTKK
ncbi:radical SAM protein [bacterium]|nr:radical SAM protein [bacterium]